MAANIHRREVPNALCYRISPLLSFPTTLLLPVQSVAIQKPLRGACLLVEWKGWPTLRLGVPLSMRLLRT